VEACPTQAITESKMFEFSFTSRADAIYTKAELVVDDQGYPKRLPWEDWREGEAEMTGGWMRATSPAGDASFEGVVQWTGDLGMGVKAPEREPRRRGHRIEAVASRLLPSSQPDRRQRRPARRAGNDDHGARKDGPA
jgi:NADH-quinone oxidoreductase subunit I